MREKESEINEQDFLRSLILERMNASRLSLRQHATRWGISSSLLSQVKNRKRKVGLDLALKVMRDCKVSLERQDQVVSSFQAKKSREFHNLKADLIYAQKKEFLSKSFSKLLVSYPFAVDIFLDIALAEEDGRSVAFIMKRYGQSGLQVAEMFSESEFVQKRLSRFYIKQIGHLFSPSKQSLFELINLINQRLKGKVDAQKFNGSFYLEVREITEDGFNELQKLQVKQILEVQSLLNEYEKNKEDKACVKRVSLSYVTGEI